MTPQRCIASADEFGDCYRACIATIVNVPISEVPHFGAQALRTTHEASALARRWLAGRGLAIFEDWVNGDRPLDWILRHWSAENPGVPLILHGEAIHKPSADPMDANHSVVVLNGKIVHDPSGAGIAGPPLGGDHCWWIEAITLHASGMSVETPND